MAKKKEPKREKRKAVKHQCSTCKSIYIDELGRLTCLRGWFYTYAENWCKEWK